MATDAPAPAGAVPSLLPLRAVIAAHGLSARKELGQNFLLDNNLTAKIARSAGPLEGIPVVEVGPGPGGLTRALIEAGAARVIGIERDPRCIAALEELAAFYPGRLDIIAADALRQDETALMRAEEFGRAYVVANLPYNIASALLVKWLTVAAWPPWYARLVLMFQKEVAERITAAPGGKTYGRLSVLSQWRCVPQRLFDLPPQAFTPPPKVTSSVVAFAIRPDPIPAPLPALETVVAAAFNQRRKMLRQSLRALGPAPEALIAAAGLDPTQRAETVAVEGFCALARAFEAARALARGGSIG